MSQEREVIDPTGIPISTEQALTEDAPENQLTRRERKARLARVLERGIVADRLHVELPPHVHGEWIPNDKAEIHRMQLLGFRVDNEYATKRALHDQGDSSSIVGDTIFMVCDRETKDLLDEIRRENYEAINGKPGQVHTAQREEHDAAANIQRTGMPIVQESRERAARKADLEVALQRNAEATANTASGGAHIIPASAASAGVPQPRPKGNIVR